MMKKEAVQQVDIDQQGKEEGRYPLTWYLYAMVVGVVEVVDHAGLDLCNPLEDLEDPDHVRGDHDHVYPYLCRREGNMTLVRGIFHVCMVQAVVVEVRISPLLVLTAAVVVDDHLNRRKKGNSTERCGDVVGNVPRMEPGGDVGLE
jgi:hypothetical protein